MREKTNELIQKLTDGVDALFQSDMYKKYLSFLASFRQYSVNNSLLILLQCPQASYVASYTDWQTKHHRRVKRGEKGIKILAPHVITQKGDDGNDVERVTGFHVATTFDISQTEPDGNGGADVPVLARPSGALLRGDDCGLPAVLTRTLGTVPVFYGDISDKSCNGFFDGSKIVISRAIMGTHQEISTLIHELAHAWLHGVDGPEQAADRRTKEVQAQSIAYIVSEYLGVDNSDYTFGYIASWSKDKSHKELTASLDVIRRTANIMIDRIEKLGHK